MANKIAKARRKREAEQRAKSEDDNAANIGWRGDSAAVDVDAALKYFYIAQKHTHTHRRAAFLTRQS